MSIWRSAFRPLLKPLVYRLRNRVLYQICSFYVNVVDNDNDCDFHTNGEETFARTRLPGCSLVFDVGAATGHWTEIALAADPNLSVHCFEPTSRRFALLGQRNFGSRVVLNKLALGDSIGTAQIFYGTSGGSNSLFPQRYDDTTPAPEDVESVIVSTIDEYCRERDIRWVDFIKMDIEGYEMAALRGAEQMLRDGKIGVVQFEYSYGFLDAGSSLLQLMQYINRINPDYEFHKIYPEGARPVPSYDHTLDNFKTQNWAIIKRGRCP